MAGLKGVARVKDIDPRQRRNFARLSQRFDDLILAAPLILDSDGRFSIDLGGGLVLSSDKLTINTGDGVELVSDALTVTPGANVSVDADGVNALSTPAWFFSGGTETARQDAVTEAAAAATVGDADVEARARGFSWFTGG